MMNQHEIHNTLTMRTPHTNRTGQQHSESLPVTDMEPVSALTLELFWINTHHVIGLHKPTSTDTIG